MSRTTSRSNSLEVARTIIGIARTSIDIGIMFNRHDWEKIKNEPGLLDDMIASFKARAVESKKIALQLEALRDDTRNFCTVCGSEFVGRTDARYCSPACRQRAYRTRQ